MCNRVQFTKRSTIIMCCRCGYVGDSVVKTDDKGQDVRDMCGEPSHNPLRKPSRLASEAMFDADPHFHTCPMCGNADEYNVIIESSFGHTIFKEHGDFGYISYRKWKSSIWRRTWRWIKTHPKRKSWAIAKAQKRVSMVWRLKKVFEETKNLNSSKAIEDLKLALNMQGESVAARMNVYQRMVNDRPLVTFTVGKSHRGDIRTIWSIPREKRDEAKKALSSMANITDKGDIVWNEEFSMERGKIVEDEEGNLSMWNPETGDYDEVPQDILISHGEPEGDGHEDEIYRHNAMLSAQGRQHELIIEERLEYMRRNPHDLDAVDCLEAASQIGA